MDNQNSDIKSALNAISANANTYAPFYNYYRGVHALNFSSRKFKNKFGQRLQRLRQNLCKIVVGAPVTRLEVIDFSAEKKTIAKATWKIWKQNKLPRASSVVHKEAFRTGDAYAIVWADETGKARILPQPAGLCYAWHDSETGEITKAAKFWQETDKFWYLTLYYADRIEKYVSRTPSDSMPDASGFIARSVFGEPHPLPNPYNRVPVFHFTNGAEFTDYGTSLLEDVIPLQDGLNKSFADLFAGMEYNALRQRYATGLQFEKDEETNKPIIPYDDDDRYIVSESETAKFGEFSDTDLDKFLNVKTSIIKDIAIVSGIPPVYFNLDAAARFPSGEALRAIEARFTSLVQDAQRAFGETWAAVMSFALQIEGISASEIEVAWSDAAPIGESERLANGQAKLGLGVSEKQVLSEIGYTDTQIAQFQTDNQAQSAVKLQSAAKFFDAGNAPPLM